ncbi:MAG UNVERIFIED_CONTAM: hypothetical protein LVR18_51045 [Planctomycetaceae bacterium]
MLQPWQTEFVLFSHQNSLLIQEVLAAQRTDRTKINDVAGQRVIDRVTGEDIDFFM